jgi:DNA mismatch repair protein MutL
VNRIRLLPEPVANQIAAGEVVERPASVVKELVENALDAEARRITVEVQAGGRSLIRVTDDGLGMSRDDALLCLERHATSKIRRAEDLAAIATMGFRGEALPSIASVSRFTLTTRERDGEGIEATQVTVAAGKILDVRAASGPPGTCVEVRQLFYNLPARRKFLRSAETERAHIQHYLLLAALAFPEVGFTFVHDGRTVWQLPPLPAGQDAASRLAAVRERLRALYGADLSLLPVDFTGELHVPAAAEEDDEPGDAAFREAPLPAPPRTTLRVWGFIGAPGVSRATREDQHLFVNRRPVENRALNFALLEGYHTALMKGRYPVCCLFLELDPAQVDVNIHPAKREVKFHAERQVRALVTQAVRRTLLAVHAGGLGVEVRRPKSEGRSPESRVESRESEGGGRGSGEAGLPAASSAPTDDERRQPDLGLVSAPGTRTPAAPTPLWPLSVPAEPAAAPPPAGPPSAAVLPPAPARSDVPAAPEPPNSGLPPALSTVGATAAGAGRVTTDPVPLLQVPLRLVGVVGRLYVVLESDRGLVLMDQHAAHERVLFEQMLARLERGPAPCQRLLLPETVEVSARDAVWLRGLLPVLQRLGVHLREFGERTFLLDGLPPFVRAGQPRQFVLELVDALRAAGPGVNPLRLGEEMVAKTVCRHAVKARDPLQGPELEKLIAELRHCAMPYTCPHGRPTLIEFNYRELERRFGRAT